MCRLLTAILAGLLLSETAFPSPRDQLEGTHEPPRDPKSEFNNLDELYMHLESRGIHIETVRRVKSTDELIEYFKFHVERLRLLSRHLIQSFNNETLPPQIYRDIIGTFPYLVEGTSNGKYVISERHQEVLEEVFRQHDASKIQQGASFLQRHGLSENEIIQGLLDVWGTGDRPPIADRLNKVDQNEFRVLMSRHGYLRQGEELGPVPDDFMKWESLIDVTDRGFDPVVVFEMNKITEPASSWYRAKEDMSRARIAAYLEENYSVVTEPARLDRTHKFAWRRKCLIRAIYRIFLTR